MVEADAVVDHRHEHPGTPGRDRPCPRHAGAAPRSTSEPTGGAPRAVWRKVTISSLAVDPPRSALVSPVLRARVSRRAAPNVKREGPGNPKATARVSDPAPPNDRRGAARDGLLTVLT